MIKPAKILAGSLALGLAALGLGVLGAEPAAAYNGQFVSTSGLHCGGQYVHTGSVSIGNVGMHEWSWVYRNCSSGTLRRKADLVNWWDGDCYGVGPGQARVLHTDYTPSPFWPPPALMGNFPFGYARGTKEC